MLWLFLLYNVNQLWKWKSLSHVWPCDPHGLYSPCNSPGQDAGVGSLSLLQGSSQPRDWAQVSRIAGGFFTSWAAREAREAAICLHICPPSCAPFHATLPLGLHSAERSSVCLMAGCRWLSLLHAVVSICQCRSQFVRPSPSPTGSAFSSSASLFLPCTQVHQYHFSRFHIYLQAAAFLRSGGLWEFCLLFLFFFVSVSTCRFCTFPLYFSVSRLLRT